MSLFSVRSSVYSVPVVLLLVLLYVVLHLVCYLFCLFCSSICCLFGDYSDLLGFDRAMFVN
jgi:ABC-type polysaccharide/polyol phosphate export permease